VRDGPLPDGWRRARLGAVAGIRTKKVDPRQVAGLPYVALEHLEQGEPKLLGWQTAKSAVSTKTLFKKGDVLFGKLRPNLKKAAPAPFDGVCSTDILPLFAHNGLEPGFLAQLCQWPPLQEHAVSTAEGTKMPRTSWTALREFVVPLPPLPEQRKIAEILSSVDDAIERTEAVIDQVRQVKQGLAQQLLTRGLPGRHTHYKQTEVGEIPACWEVVRFDSAIQEMSNGFASGARDEDGIPQLRMNNLTTDGRVVLDGVLKVPVPADVDRWTLRAGDFLFNNTNSIDLVGKCAVFEGAPFPCTYSNHLTMVRFKSDLMHPKWVLLWFVMLWSRGFFRSLAIRHVGQAAIYGSQLRRLKVPLPPLSEQQAMSQVVQAMDDRIEAERQAVERMRAAKSALMHVLLTGQVRVRVDAALSSEDCHVQLWEPIPPGSRNLP
jgi:type I restriction enzyme S subunit